MPPLPMFQITCFPRFLLALCDGDWHCKRMRVCLLSLPLVLAAVFGARAAQAQVAQSFPVLHAGASGSNSYVEITGGRLRTPQAPSPSLDFYYRMLFGSGGSTGNVGSRDSAGAANPVAPTPPAADKNTYPKDKCSSPSTGSPVKLATGEKHLRQR